MPVLVESFLQPSSIYLPFLMEDKYLRGGFQSLESIAARDSIPAIQRKAGMIVYVKESSSYYQLSDDLKTWSNPSIGGLVQTISSPFVLEDGKLSIPSKYLIPEGGEPGQVIQKQLDGTNIWADTHTSSGNRASSEYTSPIQLATGEEHKFDLTLSKTILLLTVKLNSINVEIKGYTTKDRSDKNAFTFISTADFMTDEGVTVLDADNKEYKRRFSFMANLEDPVSDTMYFTFKNMGVVPVTPKVEITYLALQ
jgi:hypothetical protein